MYEEELRKESREKGYDEMREELVRAAARTLSPEDISTLLDVPLAIVKEILAGGIKPSKATQAGLQPMQLS